MRALLALLLLTSNAEAGPCRISLLAPHAITIGGTELPPDGGVLVGMLADMGNDVNSPTALDRTRWKFVDGATSTAPVVRTIAPGLAVFEPPPGSNPLTLTVENNRKLTFKRGAAKPALGAPTVTGIVNDVSPGGPRQSPTTTITVKLTGARPDSAVAMIVFDGTTPVTWATAFNYQGPTGQLQVFRTAGRCETQIPGSSAPASGTKVTVAWVDAAGRIGAKSKVVTVAQGSLGSPTP
jgi:hypothetical protein